MAKLSKCYGQSPNGVRWQTLFWAIDGLALAMYDSTVHDQVLLTDIAVLIRSQLALRMPGRYS